MSIHSGSEGFRAPHLLESNESLRKPLSPEEIASFMAIVKAHNEKVIPGLDIPELQALPFKSLFGQFPIDEKQKEYIEKDLKTLINCCSDYLRSSVSFDTSIAKNPNERVENASGHNHEERRAWITQAIKDLNAENPGSGDRFNKLFIGANRLRGNKLTSLYMATSPLYDWLSANPMDSEVASRMKNLLGEFDTLISKIANDKYNGMTFNEKRDIVLRTTQFCIQFLKLTTGHEIKFDEKKFLSAFTV